MAKPTYEQFGLTESEAKNVKDIVPAYNLSILEDGQSAEFTIVDAMPREIEYTDKKNNEQRKELVITAVDKLTKMTVTLWLSAKSLKMEFFKLAQKKGSLKDLNVIVNARTYTHDKYGQVRGYSVQEVSKR